MTSRDFTSKRHAKKRIAAQVRASGGTQAAAAVKSGYSREWISHLENSRDAEYWSCYANAVRDMQRDAYAAAWRRLLKTLESDNTRIALNAARMVIDIVERAPMPFWSDVEDGKPPHRLS